MMDDRRQRVRPTERPRASDCLHPRAWGRALRGLGSSGDFGAVLVLGPPVVLALLFSPVLRAAGAPGWLAFGVCAVATLLVWASIAAVLAYIDRRIESADARRKRFIPVGRCAACGFSLAGLAPESDGCTLCPECGAAWRLDVRERAIRRRHTIHDLKGRRIWATAELQPSDTGLFVVPSRGRGLWFAGVTVFGAMTVGGFGVFLSGSRAVLVRLDALPPVSVAEAGFFVGAIGVTGLGLTYQVSLRRERLRRAVAGALAAERCPGCWARLGGDATACASCGAVWRVGSGDE